MKPAFIIAAAGLSFTLGACNPQPESGSDTPTSSIPSAAQSEGAAPPGADPELVAALQCWGYTRASFYLNIASPERAADIPVASNLDMEGWHWRALHLAHSRNMSLSAFEALRDEVAISNNDLIDDDERAAAAAPIQTCIDTAPTIEGDVPELRQD